MTISDNCVWFSLLTDEAGSMASRSRPAVSQASALSNAVARKVEPPSASEDEALQMKASFCDELQVVEGEPLDLSCTVTSSDFVIGEF